MLSRTRNISVAQNREVKNCLDERNLTKQLDLLGTFIKSKILLVFGSLLLNEISPKCISRPFLEKSRTSKGCYANELSGPLYENIFI